MHKIEISSKKMMNGMCNEIDSIIAEYEKECDLSKSRS